MIIDAKSLPAKITRFTLKVFFLIIIPFIWLTVGLIKTGEDTKVSDIFEYNNNCLELLLRY